MSSTGKVPINLAGRVSGSSVGVGAPMVVCAESVALPPPPRAREASVKSSRSCRRSVPSAPTGNAQVIRQWLRRRSSTGRSASRSAGDLSCHVGRPVTLGRTTVGDDGESGTIDPALHHPVRQVDLRQIGQRPEQVLRRFAVRQDPLDLGRTAGSSGSRTSVEYPPGGGSSVASVGQGSRSTGGLTVAQRQFPIQ